jgi:hypothetical protein
MPDGRTPVHPVGFVHDFDLEPTRRPPSYWYPPMDPSMRDYFLDSPGPLDRDGPVYAGTTIRVRATFELPHFPGMTLPDRDGLRRGMLGLVVYSREAFDHLVGRA